MRRRIKERISIMTDVEREIEKADHEFNVEMLCIGHSKDTLKQHLKKKHNGITEEGNELDNRFWNSISVDELQEAISRYDEEQYRQIREEIADENEKNGLKLGTPGPSKHFRVENSSKTTICES